MICFKGYVGKLAANGLGLVEMWEIETQMFDKPQMLIEVHMLKFSNLAPILPSHVSDSYISKISPSPIFLFPKHIIHLVPTVISLIFCAHKNLT